MLAVVPRGRNPDPLRCSASVSVFKPIVQAVDAYAALARQRGLSLQLALGYVKSRWYLGGDRRAAKSSEEAAVGSISPRRSRPLPISGYAIRTPRVKPRCQEANMRKSLKIAAFAVAALVVLGGVLVLGADWFAERKRTRTIEIDVAPVAYVTDNASIRRGKYLYESRGCMECHGADGARREVVNDGAGMYVNRRTSVRVRSTVVRTTRNRIRCAPSP
jgi:hypothetical protein